MHIRLPAAAGQSIFPMYGGILARSNAITFHSSRSAHAQGDQMLKKFP